MSLTCTCSCNGCPSRTQRTVKNSFPKKLLVATSVVVVLAMCLVTVEARSLEHKIRHEKRHQLAQSTKDARLRMQEARVIEHKRRPHRKQTLSLTHTAKDTDPMRLQRNAQAERFKNVTKRIINKLKNTRRFFSEERRVLNETKEYRDGMPSWLPTINFVDIHFYNYRSPRRPGATTTEKKFMYLMPKLYKSLVEYQDIFKHLINVEVDLPDEPFRVYNKTRHDLIGKTLKRLDQTVAEITENMIDVNIPVPQITKSRNLGNLGPLEVKVDAPQCLKNDYIAFRAYGNLLNNWYLEFRCPRGKKVINSNRKCAEYEAKLSEKKNTRKGKRPASS